MKLHKMKMKHIIILFSITAEKHSGVYTIERFKLAGVEQWLRYLSGDQIACIKITSDRLPLATLT